MVYGIKHKIKLEHMMFVNDFIKSNTVFKIIKYTRIKYNKHTFENIIKLLKNYKCLD